MSPGWLTVVLVALAGCGGSQEGRPPARPSRPPPSARAEQATDDPACRGITGAERLTIAARQAVTTRSGIIVRFAGAQHDRYSDGHTDLLLDLSLAIREGRVLETWVPSALAPPEYRVIGGQCIRVVDGGSGRVVLDVAAPAEPEPPDCSQACCGVDQRAPSPTGEIECCFCKKGD